MQAIYVYLSRNEQRKQELKRNPLFQRVEQPAGHC
jgi:hypothetical protein